MYSKSVDNNCFNGTVIVNNQSQCVNNNTLVSEEQVDDPGWVKNRCFYRSDLDKRKVTGLFVKSSVCKVHKKVN